MRSDLVINLVMRIRSHMWSIKHCWWPLGSILAAGNITSANVSEIQHVSMAVQLIVRDHMYVIIILFHHIQIWVLKADLDSTFCITSVGF